MNDGACCVHVYERGRDREQGRVRLLRRMYSCTYIEIRNGRTGIQKEREREGERECLGSRTESLCNVVGMNGNVDITVMCMSRHMLPVRSGIKSLSHAFPLFFKV